MNVSVPPSVPPHPPHPPSLHSCCWSDHSLCSPVHPAQAAHPPPICQPPAGPTSHLLPSCACFGNPCTPPPPFLSMPSFCPRCARRRDYYIFPLAVRRSPRLPSLPLLPPCPSSSSPRYPTSCCLVPKTACPPLCTDSLYRLLQALHSVHYRPYHCYAWLLRPTQPHTLPTLLRHPFTRVSSVSPPRTSA